MKNRLLAQTGGLVPADLEFVLAHVLADDVPNVPEAHPRPHGGNGLIKRLHRAAKYSKLSQGSELNVACSSHSMRNTKDY